MDTSALKAFAPTVRRQLIEAVTRKLDFVLSTKTPDYLTTFAPQVSALREEAKLNRTGLIERVAYTWFNRFAALRYLDAKGWHPFRARVLTPAIPEEMQPELLKLMRTGALPEELHLHTDVARLNDLLDGRIPTAINNADPQGEVYRHLVLAACRFYHSLLPALFEKLDDETELLLPDDLLTEHSVVQGFRTEITDDDCAEVELLGWLYQFYIAEKKDQVMARKSAVPTEDIPAVTQLFTPHWIVRYLVENSLGRLWLLNRPSSRLRERMPYYIEGPSETEFLKITKPEEIRLLDPAVGSGHMLTYAFDLLYAIYEEEGYAPSDIARLILIHNLYGLDIDPRAAQLASLALVLKARERYRRYFQRDNLAQPNILALQDVRFEEGDLSEYIKALKLGELFNKPVVQLMRQFEEATNFGSLIQPSLGEKDIASLRSVVEGKDLGSQLFLRDTHLKVLRVLEQADALTRRYHVVVANPPYMGSGAMNAAIKNFVKQHYGLARQDLLTCFMERSFTLTMPLGMISMINLPSWMFLMSFELFRKEMLQQKTILNLLQLGRGMFGSDFGTVAFTLKNSRPNGSTGIYRRLFERHVEVDSVEEKERKFLDRSIGYYTAKQADFLKMSGAPIAYWTTPAVIAAFGNSVELETLFMPRQGMATTNNSLFVRCWPEVSIGKTKFDATSQADARQSGRKWFPYNKGGEFRKWYGNNDFLVNYEKDGKAVCDYIDNTPGVKVKSNGRVINRSKYFLPSLTWSKVSSGSAAFRCQPNGFVFDVAGTSIFADCDESLLRLAGLMNSIVVRELLTFLAPTLNFEVGQICRVPLISGWEKIECVEAVRNMVNLVRADWDNFETSWDFSDQPLLRSKLKGATLEASWRNWEVQSTAAIRRIQELETENNRLFITAYGLDGELQPDVPEEQISLARADAPRDVKALLSYAVGCMMGRYSLDKPGLILGDAGDTLSNYMKRVGKQLEQLSFVPDEEGIIPILDGEWFEDDIVARTREFLRATFGEATLRENIRFIEETLGKDLRKYYLTDFYKNHISNERAYGYKKRPIYWLVQSPQKGFSVLIYLHRYTRDTMNLVLNRYLRPYQEKLRHRLEHLVRVQVDDGVSARNKTTARKENEKLTKILRECEEWERQTILPLAQQRIELDLDDGVKVNYQKLGEALAPIPSLAATEE